MTLQMRHSLRLLFVLVAVLTSCSGSDSGESEGTTTTSAVTESAVSSEAATTLANSAVPTARPRGTSVEYLVDPETGELVELEVENAGPTTFDEVVDEGIAAGYWEEIEGLTKVLGYAIGALPAEQVPGVRDVLTGELNELLRRANTLALSGEYSVDELADLQRWYELAVPSDEVIALLADSASDEQASGLSGVQASSNAQYTVYGAALVTQVASDCTLIDPDDFSNWGVVNGCYDKFEDVVDGATLRVFYPRSYNDDPALANLPLLAREALAASISTYKSLGEIGDIDIVFSLLDTALSAGTLAIAGDNAQWGLATVAVACPITIFPAAFQGDGPFKQTVAHEVWHCVQHYSGFEQGVSEGTKWYREGGAEYFSNVVYPTVNDEHGWLDNFDSDSRTNPLFDLSYDAWIWWQFLANRESPRAVADLQRQMDQAGDGGKSATSRYGQTFQRFVIEFTAGTISDASGEKIRKAVKFIGPYRRVTKNDAGQVREFEVEPFVAGRFIMSFDQELRVFESDQSSTTGELAMVKWEERGSQNAWKQLYPEVRSKCKEKALYVLVVTTDQGRHKAKVQIDRIEEASCDPCMLGTWDMDLETFKAMVLAAAESGEALPAGMTWEFGGHYYISMNDQAVVLEQRDGLVFTVEMGQGSLDIVIDSFAQGEYSADGERMTTSNVFEFYADVTINLAIPGFGDFATGSSILQDGSASYECNDEELFLTVDGLPPIRLIRVDKILTPPPVDAP